MISFSVTGDWKKTNTFLEKLKEGLRLGILDKYGKMGVEALSNATPVDSGLTSSSWSYKIERKKGITTISWYNSNVNKGALIAILIQYGHGTGTGGYVKGTDYINPAMKPVFDQLAEGAWKEVTSL